MIVILISKMAYEYDTDDSCTKVYFSRIFHVQRHTFIVVTCPCIYIISFVDKHIYLHFNF